MDIQNTDSDEFNDKKCDLENKIRSELNIDNFSIDFEHRDDKLCIIYSFYHADNYKSRSGFIVNNDTFIDDLAKNIFDIHDSLKALTILNSLESIKFDNKSKIQIEYVWGNSIYSRIYYWDYNKIVISLSRESNQRLLDIYRDGEETFKLKINEMINSEIHNLNIVKAINSLSDTVLGKQLGIKFESSLDIELLRCMINRADAIKICRYSDKKSNIKMQVVENINQLGNFIVLCDWDINFKKKKIDIKIRDEKVIDIAENDIISNYTICSKIEQSIKLSDIENDNIFN